MPDPLAWFYSATLAWIQTAVDSDLFYGDECWLCGGCKSLTAAVAQRRPVTVHYVQQGPRIASADERRRARRVRSRASAASRPDLFDETV